jgi:predicted nucleic acid-binding protein
LILYADTSALVKLVVTEEGSDTMRDAVDASERLTSSVLAYIELRAAMAAAFRDGRIAAKRRDDVVLALEQLWGTVSEIAVGDPVLRSVGDMAEHHELRACDAVHLASLSLIGHHEATTFACWDKELRTAARRLGFALVPGEEQQNHATREAQTS